MDNIFILDRDKIKRDILSNYGSAPPSPFYNDKRKIYLNTGAETLEFDTHGMACFNGYLKLGNYAMFKENDKYYLYQFMSMDTEHGDDMIKNCYCETVGLELRNHAVRAMTIDGDVKNFFNTILLNSPFKLGYVEDGLNEVKSIKVEKPIGAYQLIQDNLSTFNIEIEFTVEYKHNRVVGQVINVYRQRGKETNIRFEYGNNVDKVKKSEDLSEFCSALVGTGSNGCDFKNNEWKVANGNPVDKPLNQDFVADMEAFNFKNNNGSHIMGVFEGTSTNGADLLLEAWNELQRIKSPKIDYEFNVALLNVDEVGIGDTVYCIDNDYTPPLHLSARVSELELSSTDPSKNKCTLSNYKEIKSKIKSLNKEAIMDELLDYIDSLKPGILTEAEINNLKSYMQQLSLENEQVNAMIEQLKKIAYDKFVEQERHKVYGENVDIVLNEGRDYLCQNVVKYIKFTAPIECSDKYVTTLSFTTAEDAPTRVIQDNAFWLTGVDCINGGLIIKCDTTYTITISLDNNTITPRKFKGTVVKKYNGGEYFPYVNKTNYCENIVEACQTYYDKRDLFVYSTTTPYSFKNPCTATNIKKWTTSPDGNHIDCSTLVQFVLRGITYINSTYNHQDKSPYYLSTKYKYSFAIPRFAADQAKYCIEQGWQLDLDPANQEDWKKLQPGDLVFWKRRFGDDDTNATVNARFMQVGHVAIVRAVNENGIPHTYEATSGTPCIRNRLFTSNFPEKMLFFARPRK